MKDEIFLRDDNCCIGGERLNRFKFPFFLTRRTDFSKSSGFGKSERIRQAMTFSNSFDQTMVLIISLDYTLFLTHGQSKSYVQLQTCFAKLCVSMQEAPRPIRHKKRQMIKPFAFFAIISYLFFPATLCF